MSTTVTGLPALMIGIGFLVVFAAPVWLAARLVGARRPTLGRAILALVLGFAGSFASLLFTGPAVFVLAPLSFLLSFRYVLGTSFLGAIALAVLAAAGYGAMVHFIGGGMMFSNPSPPVIST